MLRESKGNMYVFVTHTWNPIKGRCAHDCVYCYMKRFPQNEIRLDDKELKTDLGKGNFIFVGSSTDMFAHNVPVEWVRAVLDRCWEDSENQYLFQSKNPGRFLSSLVVGRLSRFKPVLGTTIETNRLNYNLSKAPDVYARANAVQRLANNGFQTMVTIEPIADFDLEPLVDLVARCQPEWVNIGADSKNYGLPEPDKEKIDALIVELQKFTEVKVKDNLSRLVERCRRET